MSRMWETFAYYNRSVRILLEFGPDLAESIIIICP